MNFFHSEKGTFLKEMKRIEKFNHSLFLVGTQRMSIWQGDFSDFLIGVLTDFNTKKTQFIENSKEMKNLIKEQKEALESQEKKLQGDEDSIKAAVQDLEEDELQLRELNNYLKLLERTNENKKEKLISLKKQNKEEEKKIEEEIKRAESGIEKYKSKLSLDFGGERNELKISFKNVCEKNPEKEGTIILGINDMENYYLSYIHPQPKNIQSLMHKLNQNSNLPQFIINLRKAFVALYN